MFSSNTSQVSGGYEIQRSLRFNQADSAYLNRTPASAGNRKTWTWSAWVKRGQLGTADALFTTRGDVSDSQYFRLGFGIFNPDTLLVTSFNSTTIGLQTSAVFRDPSAWYHIVFAFDTTQATASNRMKLYVNGVQQTAFTTENYPSQNFDAGVNAAIEHAMGRILFASSTDLDGYMTEIYLIDGQALTPSSFGAFDAQTGVWGPTPYAGSYGTNGFYLNFSDNSNTTAATLGKDYSGNGNNWTPNNFSVSAGAGNDSLTDTPTNNFATLNPLQISTTYATISNGNLQYVDTTNSGSYRAAYSTVFASSGKFYFEATVSSVSGIPYPTIGLTSPPPQNDTYIEQTITGYQGYGYYSDGTKATNDTYTAFGSSYTAGDTVAVAVDIDAGKVWFAKNGTWQASGDPAAGTNPAFNIVTGRAYGFAVGNGSSATSIQMDCNFGQRPFAYTAPSGFKALNTQNLPTPTIGATTATQANKYFDATTYTATGTSQTITNSGFQPDLVWTKARSAISSNILVNSVVGANKYLRSNTTDAETTDANYLTSFNASGFSVGSSNYGNGTTMVGWQWKANGSGVTNTAGSITSTVSANTTSGFSVVTFTGTGSNATVGHGLGAAPKMILFKVRNQADNWFVYHSAIGNNKYLLLNTANSAITDAGIWQNTAPTSTVFSIGGSAFPNTWTEVAYCFAEVPGYSRLGSYTGNGSTDGPFVFCGFRPAYVMIKNTTQNGGWMLWDDVRSPANVVDELLYANLSNSETTYTGLDFTANGFKIRNTSSDFNWNGDTYIFMAVAEAPQKFALAR